MRGCLDTCDFASTEQQSLEDLTASKLPGGYVVLEEGQNHRVHIKLGQRYDFRGVGAGQFTIELRNQTTRVHDPLAAHPANLFTAEPMDVRQPQKTIDLSGNLVPVPYTLSAADILFDNIDGKVKAESLLIDTVYLWKNYTCSADQKQQIIRSALRARAGLDKVIKCASRLTFLPLSATQVTVGSSWIERHNGTDPAFQKWFGTSDISKGASQATLYSIVQRRCT